MTLLRDASRNSQTPVLVALCIVLAADRKSVV